LSVGDIYIQRLGYILISSCYPSKPWHLVLQAPCYWAAGRLSVEHIYLQKLLYNQELTSFCISLCLLLGFIFGRYRGNCKICEKL